MKKILVTGTEGFIGSRFVELNKDKYNIIKLSQSGAEEACYNPRWFKNLFEEDWKKLDGVFHIGAMTDTTSLNTQEYFLYNVLFTQMLIDECAVRNIPLIFSSSASLYGSGNNIPLNLYAWTKKVSEDYGTAKAKTTEAYFNPPYGWDNEFQFTALRYFNVYGIGEHNKNIKMTSLVYQNLGKDKIKLFKGNPKRDFIFVDDVISANIHAFETGQSGVFDCGYGEARPFEDIAAGLGAEIEYVDNPIKGQYQSFTLSDRNKLLTDWTPQYNLESGIKKTREYYAI